MVTADSIPRSIAALDQFYDLPQWKQVHAYLHRNPDLVSPLVEIGQMITGFLPSPWRPYLEPMSDPEDEHSKGTLFVVVPTKLKPEEVGPILDRMHQTWWLDAFRKAGGRLNIDIEFC